MKHKLTKNISFLIGILILLVSFPDEAISKAGKIDYEKMKRDLAIMKTILDRIMKPEDSSALWMNGNTRAIYLDGYGVIFIYQHSMSEELALITRFKTENAYHKALEHYKEAQTEAMRKYREAFKKARKATEDYDEKIKEYMENAEKKKQAELSRISERTQKTEATLKENVIEFLGEYCDAINQLKPDDRITVVIIPEMSRYILLDQFFDKSEYGTNRVIATIQKSDIASYRREAIKKKAFKQRIHFSSDEDDDRMQRDIQIMTNIFDTAIKQSPQKDLIVRGETWGTFVRNFGALFMIKVRQAYGLKIHHLGDAEGQIIINTKEESPESPDENSLENLKATLMDILGSYGHTMRKLDRDEWIGIALELKLTELQRHDRASTLFIKVRKRDADALNKEQINFTTFKQRVEVTEY